MREGLLHRCHGGTVPFDGGAHLVARPLRAKIETASAGEQRDRRSQRTHGAILSGTADETLERPASREGLSWRVPCTSRRAYADLGCQCDLQALGFDADSEG